MTNRLLLSSPLRAPGPMAALKNHMAVLQPFIPCDLISLEALVSPPILKESRHTGLFYRIAKKTKVVSVDKIIPYGENVLFGTFNPVHEPIVRKLNRIGIRPSFMWCSTLGQIECTPREREPFMRLIDLFKAGRIKYLFLHRRLYNSMGFFVKGAKFLPFSIDLNPYKNFQKPDTSDINVDLFCRPRLGKNILNQIAAFRMAEIDGTLHINFDTNEFRGIIDKISPRVVQHKWLPDDEYLSLVGRMRLSLQVTIGESFNYAVCERMCLGVPVLTTKDIYLVADDRFLATHLCVEAPDTPPAIAKTIRSVVTDDKLSQEIAARCKTRIADVARQNNKVVIDQILRCFH